MGPSVGLEVPARRAVLTASFALLSAVDSRSVRLRDVAPAGNAVRAHGARASRVFAVWRGFHAGVGQAFAVNSGSPFPWQEESETCLEQPSSQLTPHRPSPRVGRKHTQPSMEASGCSCWPPRSALR